MPRVNKSVYAVLGCLSLRNMSAYEIKSFIQRSISHFWSESEGQIYPTLRKLEQDRCVKMKEAISEKGVPKKIYSITNVGRRKLKAWISGDPDELTYRNELLLKLFFGSESGVHDSYLLLENNLKKLESKWAILKGILLSLSDRPIPPERLIFLEMTLDYGLSMISAEIKWNKKALKQLESHKSVMTS